MKYLILLISAFAATSGHARTWSSSGNDDGEVCFVKEEAAEVYRQTGSLQEALKVSPLQYVKTLDLYENPMNSYVMPNPGDTTWTYLQWVLQDRLQTTAPTFYAQLLQALRQVNITTATGKRAVPNEHDTGVIGQWAPDTNIATRAPAHPSRELKNCVPMPIAWRHLNMVNGRMHITLEKVPELYNLLGINESPAARVVYQAASWLHEGLYLMAAQHAQTLSFDSMRLTAVLLSNDKINTLIEIVEQNHGLGTGMVNNLMRNELTADGFGGELEGQDPDPRLVAGLKGFDAKNDAKNQAMENGDLEGSYLFNEAVLTKYFDSLSAEEGFFVSAYVAVTHREIKEMNGLLDRAAKTHFRDVHAVCTRIAQFCDNDPSSTDDLKRAHAEWIQRSRDLCRQIDRPR